MLLVGNVRTDGGGSLGSQACLFGPDDASSLSYTQGRAAQTEAVPGGTTCRKTILGQGSIREMSLEDYLDIHCHWLRMRPIASPG